MLQASAAIVVASGVGGDGHRLAIVADRQLSGAALTALIVDGSRYQLVQQARGVAATRQALDDFQPAVVIIDASWSERTSLVDALGCDENVLILLDPYDHPAVFIQAAGARARGYLSRTASRQALHDAIERVRGADDYLDAAIAGRILGAMRQVGNTVAPRAGLSPRERDILIRIAGGQSTKEIGRDCAITPKTVANHVNNLSHKLHARNRGQLVLYAAQQGLTTI
jgi:DNA-binding NarL/FixJ family response regulator